MACDPVSSMMGLCQKAGKLKSGAFSVEEAVKGRKAKLVIIATDASERTIKTYKDMCSYYETPLICFSTKAEISKAIGKQNRTAIAIMDEHFADEINGRIRKG